MVRWFVLASVPSLPFGTGKTGGSLNEEVKGVVLQPLRLRHHGVEMGIHIQHVDHEQVQVIALPFRNQVSELKSGGDDLNLRL